MKTIKRIFLAAVLFFAFFQAEAQVTFKPGLRAGANFSHFTKGDYQGTTGTYYDGFEYVPYNSNDQVKFSSKTDFYVGFYGALHLTKYYTLQPEVTYSRQGSKVEWASYNPLPVGATQRHSDQIDISYLSIAIINKFTFTDKFNVHLGPTIDFIVDKNNLALDTTPYNSGYYVTDSDVDLSFVFGFGYNFTKNLGIEARVKKGVIPVLDFDDNHTNVVFSAGLTYTFDLK